MDEEEIGEDQMSKSSIFIEHEPTQQEPWVNEEAIRAGQDRFISIWGEMGSSWGIPRTMAEVHALLYISDEPMCTDEIMDRLRISRGSASTSIRNLLDWGVLNRSHKRGDRKDYFRAEQDVWQMFRIILRERKRREIDPVLMSLYECRDFTSNETIGDTSSNEAVTHHNTRLDAMLRFMELIDTLADEFISPAGHGLRAAAGLLGKVE